MDRLLEATARAERHHFWFNGFRRFVKPLLEEAARRPPRRILDAGCGTGHNLLMLRRYGPAIGIDLTYSGLRYSHAYGEPRVAQASATALPFGDGTFDLVTSFDVLYALDDDQEPQAIAEMARVLSPEGHLIVNVAALPALRGNHSVLGGEVRRYRKAELREHLERAGFRVGRITYTNASLLPMVAGIRLLQRLSGHRESSREISVPWRPINAVLSGVLAAEAGLLRIVDMPLGSSLLALAQKRAGPGAQRTATE